MNRLKQLIREKMPEGLDGSIPLRQRGRFRRILSFIVSGAWGIVQYWPQTGLKETPMQMARLTEQIITQGIGVLEIDPYA